MDHRERRPWKKKKYQGEEIRESNNLISITGKAL
jgi:hypothetical protein